MCDTGCGRLLWCEIPCVATEYNQGCLNSIPIVIISFMLIALIIFAIVIKKEMDKVQQSTQR